MVAVVGCVGGASPPGHCPWMKPVVFPPSVLDGLCSERVTMAGVEEQQLRLQRSVDTMVEGLEREVIRVMQGKMFRCSAQCCEKEGSSMQQVHQCIERCHTPMGHAQSTVTTELDRFQNRLARCTMNCNDKAKDALDTGAKESNVRPQLESCVSRCADEHMNLIPSMTRKLKESLAAIPQ